MASKKGAAKRPRRWVKNGLIQARVDNDELQIIVTKAHLYCKGNMSNYVRLAAVEYKGPLKKTEK